LPDAYGALKQNFNQALDELDSAMRGVRNSISTIDAAAAEISSASEDLSRRTEGQAASLEQTTAALAEITTTIRKTADNAGHARKLVATAKVEAEKGGTVVTDAIDAMRGIESASKEINQIIGVIDEIAFQTNLLALNAGVEAARAGDAGRGFAVVASEVRALALRSADAAKQIKALIASSTAQVDRGVDLVNRTGSALKAIVSGVSDINTAVTDIAESAEEQATGVSEVNSAVGTMDQMTQQNAAMVEQSTAAARTLSELTSNLMQLIGRFQTSDQADAGDRSLHAATGVRTGPAASETRRRDGEGPRAGAPKRAVS
jgi:methyl-accepting chemotaxis protein